MFTRNQVESLGRRLLEGQPNAIVRYRILRYVLRLPPCSADLETARLQMLSHPWVDELAREQHPYGSRGDLCERGDIFAPGMNRNIIASPPDEIEYNLCHDAEPATGP